MCTHVPYVVNPFEQSALMCSHVPYVVQKAKRKSLCVLMLALSLSKCALCGLTYEQSELMWLINEQSDLMFPYVPYVVQK